MAGASATTAAATEAQNPAWGSIVDRLPWIADRFDRLNARQAFELNFLLQSTTDFGDRGRSGWIAAGIGGRICEFVAPYASRKTARKDAIVFSESVGNTPSIQEYRSPQDRDRLLPICVAALDAPIDLPIGAGPFHQSGRYPNCGSTRFGEAGTRSEGLSSS